MKHPFFGTRSGYGSESLQHTVDGRNPAPPGMYKTPANNGINYLSLNWCSPDFSHQRYLHLSLVYIYHHLSIYLSTIIAVTTRFFDELMGMAMGTLPRTGKRNARRRDSMEVLVSLNGCVFSEQFEKQFPLKLFGGSFL